MEAIRVQQTIEKKGELTLRNLPIEKGQQVEVLLLFTPTEKGSRPRLTARQLLQSLDYRTPAEVYLAQAPHDPKEATFALNVKE